MARTKCSAARIPRRLPGAPENTDQKREQSAPDHEFAALAALSPKPLGRRPQTPEDVEVQQLQERIGELEAQLQVAAVRTEVAAILPHTAAAVKKKSLLRLKHRRLKLKRLSSPRCATTGLWRPLIAVGG